MDPRDRALPDFSSWSTNRLKFMLHEYTESIPSIKALHGKTKQAIEDEKLYRKWIAAIQAELTKRQAIH